MRRRSFHCGWISSLDLNWIVLLIIWNLVQYAYDNGVESEHSLLTETHLISMIFNIIENISTDRFSSYSRGKNGHDMAWIRITEINWNRQWNIPSFQMHDVIILSMTTRIISSQRHLTILSIRHRWLERCVYRRSIIVCETICSVW